jgi:ABC-type multidrug transport system fused ATPase/permease subunit
MKLLNNLYYKKREIALLLSSLKSARRNELLGLLFLSLLSAVCEAVNLGILLTFLRYISTDNQGIFRIAFFRIDISYLTRDTITVLASCLVLLAIVISIRVRIAAVTNQLYLGASISSDIGEAVFERIVNMPYLWHIENNSSKILGNLTKDVDQVNSSIQAFLSLIVNLSVSISLALAMITIAPALVLIIIITLLIFYALIFVNNKSQLMFYGEKLVQNYDSSLKVAQEALGSIRDIKLDNTQDIFLKDFSTFNRDYRDMSAKINSKAQIPRYYIEGILLIMVIVIGIYYSKTGNLDTHIATIGALSLGAYRFIQPVQLCFGSIAGMRANHASWIRLKKYLTKNKEVKILHNKIVPKSVCGESNLSAPLIQLVGVSFRYPGCSLFAVDGLNISISKGETVALVGSTGSGKSTIADLLLGLIPPTSGKVLIEGHDIWSSSSSNNQWTSRVAHVPQAIYLCDSTIQQNIAFGVPTYDIDINRVKSSASLASIDSFIETLPNSYLTTVGERGIKLSGGQRQRIGIARAFYKSADFLLLDEATSALDNLTEARIINSITPLLTHSSIVMIAHRLSTIKNCDRILYIDDGRVVADGPYNDLINNNPAFKALAFRDVL